MIKEIVLQCYYPTTENCDDKAVLYPRDGGFVEIEIKAYNALKGKRDKTIHGNENRT